MSPRDGAAPMGPFLKHAPHDVEAEQSTLGGLLLNNRAWFEVSGIVNRDDFYTQDHRVIFDAIEKLSVAQKPVDFVTISNHLRDIGKLEDVGGMAYLGTLAADTPGAANVKAYAEIVREKSLRRSLIALGQDIADMGYSSNGRGSAELLSEIEVKMSRVQVRKASSAKNMAHIIEIGEQYIRDSVKRRESGDSLGVPTGIPWIDKRTGGWQPGQLIVVAARPSVGKTAFLNQTGLHAARLKMPGLLCSLEMTDAQLSLRALAHASGCNMTRLKFGGQPENDAAFSAAVELATRPLFVDTESYDLNSIVAQIAYHKRTQDIRFAAVDHIGLVEVPGNLKAVDRITMLTRRFKKLGKQLDIPIILLSQLNRDVEKEKRPPRLSDLRDSGCLTGDTMVYMPDLGRAVRIDSLVGTTPVIAANTDGGIINARASAVFSTGQKQVFSMATGSGQQIKATGCHRFLTQDGWKRLENIAIGEKIASSSWLPTHNLRDTINFTEASLMGMLIGNGCILPRHAIQFTCNALDEDLADDVKGMAKIIFRDAVNPRICKERSWIQVYLPASKALTHGVHNPIYSWFESHGIAGLKSYEKLIPNIIFSQSNFVVASFLKGLWSTDGCLSITKRKTRGEGKRASRKPPSDLCSITYSSSSYALAEGVSMLLLRFGIKTRVNKVIEKNSPRGGYHVTVIGLQGKRRFLECVGVLGIRRNAIASRMKSLLDKSRAHVRSDIYWDRVKSIKESGLEDVYDITVPVHHNFVANGLVVHNSLEQDADVVLFLHTPAQDGTIPLPIEFHLAKNRDGRRGSSGTIFEFHGATQTYSAKPQQDEHEGSHPEPPQSEPMFNYND